MSFQPDYRYMLDVTANRRPERMPVYEHIISPKIMEQVLHRQFADLQAGQGADLREFFTCYCQFFQEMTYDTVSFEVCITDNLPEHGAIMGGRPGPIQDRKDFETYPWDELSQRFWEVADPQFAMLGQCLPEGMKALGGVGNGVFEISEDLVGFEYLCYMMSDDPELVADLYGKIGDLMLDIWTEFLKRYADHFAICRFGDDLGFKTSTLISPRMITRYVMPQYQRIIDCIHEAQRPFLWHSCGNIFVIMDDMIALGIDAKHSNEEVIAPYEKWIELYTDRIGLLGGIDVDLLCCEAPDTIITTVIEKGTHFRNQAQGYALGSGNSIPDYVPVEGYLAMIEGARRIRTNEKRI